MNAVAEIYLLYTSDIGKLKSVYLSYVKTIMLLLALIVPSMVSKD